VTVGIIGAGAMGRSIARATAAVGMEVLLYDAQPDAAQEAVRKVGEGVARQVAKGRLTQDEADRLVGKLQVVSSVSELRDCSLVIEAVIEDLAVKRVVFEQVEKVVSPTCVLATNTSSLSIGAVFRELGSPRRAVGLHFFNPAHVMKLVEVIPGPYTDEDTLARAHEFVAMLGKTAIEAQDSPGFVVNLAGRAYVTEALAIVQEGTASPAQVDRIMKHVAGFPLGPLELMDMTGIDVNYPVTQNLFEHNFAEPRLRSTWLHRYNYESGLLGQKTGRGFHDYSSGASSLADEPDIGAPSDDGPPVWLVPEHERRLVDFCQQAGLRVLAEDDDKSPILCAPVGEDCAAVAARTQVDARRLVGVDLAFGTTDLVTLMAPPGVHRGLVDVVAAVVGQSRMVEVIADSAGFVAQRVIAAVANLGCDMAQRRVAAPRDIDVAVELGLRYPRGPLALADTYGLGLITEILEGLHRTLKDERYRTSQWLRRRTLLGLSIYEPDFAR
jgi:3-hydroxybutyryl-CoA dehydrogenase